MKRTTIRKAICLLMVAMLALSLSVAVFAREERCSCGGRFVTRTTTEVVGSHFCQHSGRHSITAKVTRVVCNSCGAVESEETGSEYDPCTCGEC